MSNRTKGILLAISGPILWGISGNVAQYLFTFPSMTPQWIVNIRMLGTGTMLLAWCLLTNFSATMRVWKDPKMLLRLLVFGVAGIFTSQFTYFSAVQEMNSATATIIQLTGIIFIILYLSISQRHWPRRVDAICVGLAIVGTFLLITHGKIGSLAVSPMGAFWGIASGVGTAFYTIIPRNLLKVIDAKIAIGWAMLFAGLGMLPLTLQVRAPQFTPQTVIAVGYVTIFGTMVAYLLFVASLKYLRATTASIMGVFEPLTATIVGMLVFNVRFGGPELVGALLIVMTTFLQALPTDKLLRIMPGGKAS